MAKYDPLYTYLHESGEPVVQMTFKEISDLVGGLPKSASKYQAWWANEKNGPHVQAHAWVAAGYRVDSFVFGSHVIFLRS